MKRYRVILGVGALLLVVAGLYLNFRSRDPAVAAREGMSAILKERPRDLYRRRAVHEAKLTGVTEESFVKLYHAIVLPAMRKLKATGSTSVEIYGDPPRQAISEHPTLLPDGTVFKLMVAAYVTEDGPRWLVVKDSLTLAWVADYAATHTEIYRSGRMRLAEAKLAGLRRDREFLQSLGIRGFALDNGRLMTWDELDQSWTGWLSRPPEEVAQTSPVGASPVRPGIP